MASKSTAWVLLWVALATVTGCADDDPPVVELTTLAGRPVALAGTGTIESDDVEYRWELVGAPERSRAVLPSLVPDTSFTPDVRGVYGIERYVTVRFTEELTDRFVITATGVPPQPVISAPATAVIGSRVALDSSRSASAEQLPLELTWRLVARPAASTAALESLTTPLTGFTPDVAGDYLVELTVFDGELYSFNTATSVIHAD